MSRKQSTDIESVEGNMLDGLKQELGLTQEPRATNIKQQELQDAYRGSVVYDENDEYDSEEEEAADGKMRRRSFRKS